MRFAASKLAEGDELILEKLGWIRMKRNLEHIVKQMETERGLDRSAAIAICALTLLKKSALRP